MNHSFVKGTLSNACAKCKRSEMDHSDFAECEACNNIGPCEIINGMLLCAEHYDKEKALLNKTTEKTTEKEVDEFDAMFSSTNEIKKVEEVNENIDKEVILSEEEIHDAVVDSAEQIARSMKIDTSITTSQEFFNAETVSIVDLEKFILADENVPAEHKYFKLVEQVKARYVHLKNTLFEVKKLELDIISRQRALQYRLQDLASKFKKEDRDKLRLEDITYVPKETPKKVKVPRMSAEDKLTLDFAKRLRPRYYPEIKEWDNLTTLQQNQLIAKAKVMLDNQLKELE